MATLRSINHYKTTSSRDPKLNLQLKEFLILHLFLQNKSLSSNVCLELKIKSSLKFLVKGRGWESYRE